MTSSTIESFPFIFIASLCLTIDPLKLSCLCFFSIYRSVLSAKPAVTPHEADSLCPAANPGSPTIVAPASFHSGVSTLARYHWHGNEGDKCGSLHSIGLPVSVCVPDTAQLFEPPLSPNKVNKALMSSDNLST